MEKPFLGPHSFGHHLTRMKEFPEIGYEGPLMDFGNAIEESEGRDGKLTLMVTRTEKPIEIVIKLEAIGEFSKTYPFHCKKSALLAKRAAGYLSNHPFIQREKCHAKSMSGLALLASGELEQAKKLAHSWLEFPREGIWVWPVSYQCIFFSEYCTVKDTTCRQGCISPQRWLWSTQWRSRCCRFRVRGVSSPTLLDS